jgi:hypothetical protein
MFRYFKKQDMELGYILFRYDTDTETMYTYGSKGFSHVVESSFTLAHLQKFLTNLDEIYEEDVFLHFL